MHYAEVNLDVFVVMPNHVHGIIVLGDVGPGPTQNTYDDPVGAGPRPAQTDGGKSDAGGSGTRPYTIKRHGLSEIVRGFKSMSARRINEVRKSPGKAVWQRSFYDRVIRDEDEWQHICEYIKGNPAQWAADRENPSVKIRKGDKKSPWL